MNCIKTKISKGIGIISRVRSILPLQILVLLYNTFIHPYLAYCNIIWRTAKISSLNPLLLLQNRAVRMCTNSSYRASSGPLFIKLRVLNTFDLNNYLTAIFMHKYLNNFLPASCNIFIQSPVVTFNYNLRNVGIFKINRYTTSYKENCISIRGPKLWNYLSNYISTSLSLSLFKKMLYELFSTSYVPICL